MFSENRFIHLDSKKIDKKNRGLLELRFTAVKEQKKVQELSRDKGNEHSKSQTAKDKASVIEKCVHY